MSKGKVYLLGAGPGFEDLITVRGLTKLRKADVIVYDRLVNKNLLSHRKKGARLVYVGKENRHHSMTQDRINEVLAQEAGAGNLVVRLKGGDPYVFGRGSEEALYLLERGIDFEVVPGISSFLGGLAYAGIPLSHRELSRSFHIVTGHKADGSDLNFRDLVDLEGTLVFLMSLARAGEITRGLMEAGMDPNTPAAVIENAANFNTRKLISTVEMLEEGIKEGGYRSPSLIAIGKTIGLSEDLDFLMRKPLFSKNVVLFRDRIRGEKSLKAFWEMGANAVLLPSFKIGYIDPETIIENTGNPGDYDLMVFSSQNAVEGFFEALFTKYDLRSLAGVKFLAIGPKTVEALEKYYIRPDYMASQAVGESMLEKVKEISRGEKLKVLYPRSNITRDEIIEGLAAISDLTSFPVYENVREEGGEADLDEILKLDSPYLVFTSTSSFENFLEAHERGEELLDKGKIISIGPITTRTIEDKGYSVYRESQKTTIEDIIDIIRED